MTPDTTRIAQADLAQLLGSRLCHDLVSPLGAIGNGVELLEMSSDFPGIAASPELMLIAESVAAARARIQLFRVAFGMAQGDQRMSRAGLAQLLDGFSGQGRLRVRLEAEGRVVHSYGHGGAGVTLSWGCADEVRDLVAELVG